MVELIVLAVTAAITENIVFCRGLEHGMYSQERRSSVSIVRMGLMATLLTTIAGLCGWVGRFAADNLFELLSWTRSAMFVAVYGIAIVLLMVIINVMKTLIGGVSSKLATRLVYGFVPLGTLFIVGNSTMGALQATVYGLGAGVGFLLASLLNHSIQVRIAHSDVPIVFQGMPITLLILGMMSLAIFGLLGHPLQPNTW